MILVNTAGSSGRLFETIENDPNSDFYKHYMLVNKSKGKIFNDKFLEEQKLKDPGFYYREYEGHLLCTGNTGRIDYYRNGNDRQSANLCT